MLFNSLTPPLPMVMLISPMANNVITIPPIFILGRFLVVLNFLLPATIDSLFLPTTTKSRSAPLVNLT